jgi:hypothetical protein
MDKTLDSEVLKLAVRARNLLQRQDLKPLDEKGAYVLLEHIWLYAIQVHCRYEPFIAAMMRTYQDERAERDGQGRLFDKK